MWIIMPLITTLAILMPGPVAAVWGLVVIVRRKTRLTQKRTITDIPAVALGVIAFVVGLAYVPLLIYWAIVNYPRGW